MENVSVTGVFHRCEFCRFFQYGLWQDLSYDSTVVVKIKQPPFLITFFHVLSTKLIKIWNTKHIKYKIVRAEAATGSVLKNFAKFTGKHLCRSLFVNTDAGLRPISLLKRLWHRCFPLNFAKFLRTPYLQSTSSGCFCKNMEYKYIIFFVHFMNDLTCRINNSNPVWTVAAAVSQIFLVAFYEPRLKIYGNREFFRNVYKNLLWFSGFFHEDKFPWHQRYFLKLDKIL